MVYLIEMIGQGICKVGHSANPIARMKMLQIGSPHKLALIGTLPGASDEEGEIHGLFDGQRVNGEWFYFSDELANVFCPVVEGEFEPISHFTCGSPYCKNPSHALETAQKVAKKSMVTKRGYLWMEGRCSKNNRVLLRYDVKKYNESEWERLKSITAARYPTKTIKWSVYKTLDMLEHNGFPHEFFNQPHV